MLVNFSRPKKNTVNRKGAKAQSRIGDSERYEKLKFFAEEG